MTDITKQKIIKRFLGIRHAYLLPIFHYKSFYHTSRVGSSPTHVQGGRSDLFRGFNNNVRLTSPVNQSEI